MARHSALMVLNHLDRSGQSLDAAMAHLIDEKQSLSRLDRSFVNHLVYGVLRWRRRLDWVIAAFSHVRLDRIEPPVRNLLRLALFQMMFMDRVPVSAAVNTAVELSKSLGEKWVVKYVNALLRKAAAEHAQVPLPDPETDPAAHLAVSRSFPDGMVHRWLERFGLPETTALCDALNRLPPITVRTNTMKTDRETLHRALLVEARAVRETLYSNVGLSFSHPKLPLPNLASYQRGWFQVQDEAAQLVTRLLEPRTGETVMDACAGLGGKTGYLAQLMQNRGRIVAVDVDKDKLARLRSEMMHLGFSIVTTNTRDLDGAVPQPPTRRFDRILLDAPCSGLGVLRRHPDAKWKDALQHLDRHHERQVRFLEHLAPLLKKGGVLLYAVCSMEPEETDRTIAAFLQRRPEFTVQPPAEIGFDNRTGLVSQDGCFRSFPHRHDMDGFFAARLKRMQ